MVTTLSTSCNCRSQTWLVYIFCYRYILSIAILICFSFLKMCTHFFGTCITDTSHSSLCSHCYLSWTHTLPSFCGWYTPNTHHKFKRWCLSQTSLDICSYNYKTTQGIIACSSGAVQVYNLGRVFTEPCKNPGDGCRSDLWNSALLGTILLLLQLPLHPWLGFSLLNCCWAFSVGRFYRMPLPAACQTPNLEENQWFRAFQLSPQEVPSV
jgi:hypothetical protein